jgi:hypothetical protein
MRFEWVCSCAPEPVDVVDPPERTRPLHTKEHLLTRKRLGRLSVLMVALGAAALMATTAALAGHGNGGPERQDANLRPVPHDSQADSGSNVTGKAQLRLRGANRLQVNLKARGLSPDLPHAIHIHGKDHPEIANCPGADRRDDLVDDGLIETVEGIDDYGPVRVSFTTRGDTSTDSTLALDRFPVARGNGSLGYHRAFQIPADVAQRLGDHHLVIHGEDLNGDGAYGGRTTALGAPLEAELPVACGELSPKH